MKYQSGRSRLIFCSGTVFLSLLATSCGPASKFYALIDSQFSGGKGSPAYDIVRKNKGAYSRKEKLLYLLDLGITAHYTGKWKLSNKHLQEAKDLGERLHTKSFSLAGLSFMLNDYVLPYRGEDFERALIHLFMALNYIKLNQLSDALVEARQLDSRLRVLNDHYPKGKKNIYREDAFIRFVAGLFYEMDGKMEDAYIEYMKALEIFNSDYRNNYGTTAPDFLIENLMTAADGAQFTDRLERLRKQYPRAKFRPYGQKRQMAEIVTIHYSGRSPEKVKSSFGAQVAPGVAMEISIPQYQALPRFREGARVALVETQKGLKSIAATEVMENIEMIAMRNLDNRVLRMQAKAIAQVTAKYLIIQDQAKRIREKYGDNAAYLFLTSSVIITNLISQPDLRSCRLLPAEIRVSRQLVPPGNYQIMVTPPGESLRKLKTIDLKSSQKEFIILRSVK